MGFIYRRLTGRTETELEDVIRNLRHVLGARRGAASILPDFGLSGLVPSTPEELYKWIDREVRQVILRYEPRVEIVEIEEDYDEDGRPRLRLHLRLRSSAEDLRLLLDPRRQELTGQGAG
jgi:predicted component of type VI protein secretion system